MTQTPLKPLPPGYRTQSSDTHPDAEQIIFQRLRQMSPGEKAQMVRNATKQCWRLSLIGIWNQYPQANPHQVRREFIRRRFGVQWVDTLCSEDDWGLI